jgi:ABC-2 type transport system ATP-binding protein
MPAIEVQGLKKRYGRHEALKGIDMCIEPGEVVGFLGPNGAGKSTAMKILTGFLSPTAGTARIGGHDVVAQPIEARSQIGYLPENAPIYPDMRVREFLDYVARIRGLGPAERVRAIARVAEQCGVEERLEQLIGTLSKGYRQRVGLAQALIHEPRILILDEPTTGLDPNQIVDIRNLVRNIGRNRTVLLSTHILSEVQATCDRVIIINRGELVADGTTAEVTARTQGGTLVHVLLAPGSVNPPRDRVAAALSGIEGVTEVLPMEATEADHHAHQIMASRDIRADVFALAVEQGMTLLELAPEKTNLEEVFRRLTAG